MRILLIITTIHLFFISAGYAQNDFSALDRKTYDYYNKGDYRNLKRTADSMIINGIDYYYLRMRLGIAAYKNHSYRSAVNNLRRALTFNSLDTVSRELIYYSYLFSGRDADANLYLKKLPEIQKNRALSSVRKPGLSNIYVGSSLAGYDFTLYEINSLSYEAIKSSLSINAGLESYFLNRFKATLAYTNLRRTGKVYSAVNPLGRDLNFTQNQFYGSLDGSVFPGWKFSGFGHVAFYSETLPPRPNGTSVIVTNTEYVAGFGISKTGWKIRTGANFSVSNFTNSRQLRGEGYLTYLPMGNLNLYLTSGGMYQSDKNWGSTYQINGEIGFKVFKSLWFETGFLKGNSFLYARNLGSLVNNSFLIPATTIYSNFILLPGKKFSITVSPYYNENHSYSWDLNAYMRTNKLTIHSFGGAIKLTYKINYL